MRLPKGLAAADAQQQSGSPFCRSVWNTDGAGAHENGLFSYVQNIYRAVGIELPRDAGCRGEGLAARASCRG